MYIESEVEYGNAPKWVESIIQLGYTWDSRRSPWKRRICLVSMPCKSVSAALIAVGVLRRDLERSRADNLHGHLEAISRARGIFLNNTQRYNGIVRNIRNNKKWVFTAGADEYGIAVQPSNYKKKVIREGRLIDNRNGPVVVYIAESNAKDWVLDGDAPVEIGREDRSLSEDDYFVLPGCEGKILVDNLHRSYSGLLLVGGGVARNTSYMDDIYGVSFSENGNKISLGKLLTVHAPEGAVRRMKVVNSRDVYKQNNDCSLVITDGAKAFLKALSHFTNSDIICVYSRDAPPEGLIDISNKLGEIERYYSGLSEYKLSDNLSHIITCGMMERL